MPRGSIITVLKLGPLAAVLCSVLLYYLGLRWVQQDSLYIVELFVAGVDLCLSVLLVYLLAARTACQIDP